MVVDIQEKLLPRIDGADRIVERSVRMIEGAKVLGVPVIATEQYPKGIGPTVEPVRQALGDATVLEKTAFSSLGDSKVVEAVRATAAKTLFLVGIEAHVCITQTALDGLDMSLAVHVVTDAVGSRDSGDRDVALRRIESAGAALVTSEMALFEWVKDASSPAFKGVLNLVK
jgi:nicotinamidase-related amidase